MAAGEARHKTRRSWRKLHIGLDAGSGQIVAASFTAKEVDDGAEVGPLLDQITGAVASFTGDGGYDQDRVYASVAERYPEAAVGRFKQVIGDRLHACTDERRETEVGIAAHALNRMVELGRPNYVRTA